MTFLFFYHRFRFSWMWFRETYKKRFTSYIIKRNCLSHCSKILSTEWRERTRSGWKEWVYRSSFLIREQNEEREEGDERLKFCPRLLYRFILFGMRVSPSFMSSGESIFSRRENSSLMMTKKRERRTVERKNETRERREKKWNLFASLHPMERPGNKIRLALFSQSLIHSTLSSFFSHDRRQRQSM